MDDFLSTTTGDEIWDMNVTTASMSVMPRFSYSFLVKAFLTLLTILTNVMILMAFARQKRLWTYNNYYVFNMTLADLLVGAVIMPIRTTIELYGMWVLGRVFGVIYLTVMNASLGVSVMGVVVITIDRYVATLHPMTHYTKKSKRVAVILNFLTWLLPFVLWTLLNAVWDFVDPVDGQTGSGLPRPHYTVTLGLSLCVVCIRFGIPFLIIALLYLRIYSLIRSTQLGLSVASDMSEMSDADSRISSVSTPEQFNRAESTLHPDKKGSGTSIVSVGMATISDALTSTSVPRILDKSRQSDDDSGNKDDCQSSKNSEETMRDSAISVISANDLGKRKFPRQRQRESPRESHKAMRTLTFIIVAFAISWIPNVTNVLFYSISPTFYNMLARKLRFNEVVRWISFSNSMFNPVAYAMAQPLIRTTLRRMLCCRGWRR